LEAAGDNAATTAGSFLTRRLGLIVGASLGCVVFLVLVAGLSYTKIRQGAKRAQEDRGFGMDCHPVALDALSQPLSLNS